jgi:hypothetical protein
MGINFEIILFRSRPKLGPGSELGLLKKEVTGIETKKNLVPHISSPDKIVKIENYLFMIFFPTESIDKDEHNFVR